MAQNNQELLDQYRERLTLLLKAETKIVNGGESYTIGNRTLTRPDLKQIQKEIGDLNIGIIKLSRGNRIRVRRVVPRDI